ncbi:MAG: hypothetical protein HZA84_03595, partial [Thaumarchaeota archaeon]|nr:hypothetical protein [Nitrososphaerota archaeon]
LKYKKLGVEEIAAILEIADKQPNEKFRKFLYSYASILKTDVSLLHSHLSSAVTDAYLSLEHSVESKRNTLTPLFMMASSAAFVGPMFVVLLLKFPNVPASLLLFGINLMPFLTMIMIFSVGGIRIFSEDIVKFSKRSLIAGIPSFVTVYLVNYDPLVSSGAALTCIAAWNWIDTRKQDSSINVIESEIPTALRIITKKTEIGLDLFSSLKEIASEKIFSRSFRQVFSNILFDLNSGVPVVNAIYRKNTPSYVMRMTLFVIYAFFESGATNSIALDKFTTMMEKITRTKKQFQSGMILNSVAMLLSPISILFTFLLTMSLFNIDLSAVTNSLPGFQGLVMTDNKAVASGLKPAVLFFGICAGLTVSSSALFSIKRTLPLAIATGISTVTLALWDYVVANVKITGVF